MRSILAVGHDEDLLKTRASVLRLTSAEVIPVRPHDAIPLLAQSPVDIVVMCHTLTIAEMADIAAAARRGNDKVRVLRIAAERDARRLPQGDPAGEEASSEPGSLVAKVAAILGVC